MKEDLNNHFEIENLNVAKEQLRVVIDYIAKQKALRTNGTVNGTCSMKSLSENEAFKVKAQGVEVEGMIMECNDSSESGPTTNTNKKWRNLFANSLTRHGLPLTFIPLENMEGN